jgi:hypothetical protein
MESVKIEINKISKSLIVFDFESTNTIFYANKKVDRFQMRRRVRKIYKKILCQIEI